jgi:CHAD domain-containing protein/adenylate cyclase class IV
MHKLSVGQTWGEAALAVLAQENRRIVRHEAGSRLGTDPEELHQMRVGTRRLRSALRLFEDCLKLPRACRRKAVELATALGAVRDLDVQIGALRDHYLPLLPAAEQERLRVLIAYLEAERAQKRAGMLAYLDSAEYAAYERAMGEFLAQPRLKKEAAGRTLYVHLPGLLRTQFAKLWQHPGWGEPDIETLHALRIAVKRVRYTLEFFLDCYGRALRSFYQALKRLQEELGIIHDCDVLLGALTGSDNGTPDNGTPWHPPMTKLAAVVRQERRAALRRFRRLRDRLTDERTRSAVAVWAGWPGGTDELELFEHNRRPGGALTLERKYPLDQPGRCFAEARLVELGFRDASPVDQTDHFLEVLSPHQYLRLRREQQNTQVRHLLCRRDFGPSGSRRAVEEPITPFVYEAFLARFHQLAVPVVDKLQVRWSGYFEQVPLQVRFDRLEGIGPYSGEYVALEVTVPDRELLTLAEERLQTLANHLGLAEAARLSQSTVGLLIGWIAGQQATEVIARAAGKGIGVPG